MNHAAQLRECGIGIFHESLQSCPGKPGQVSEPFGLLKGITRGSRGQQNVSRSFQLIAEFGPGGTGGDPPVEKVLFGFPPEPAKDFLKGPHNAEIKKE
jgi:hypothetical protein